MLPHSLIEPRSTDLNRALVQNSRPRSWIDLQHGYGSRRPHRPFPRFGRHDGMLSDKLQGGHWKQCRSRRETKTAAPIPPARATATSISSSQLATDAGRPAAVRKGHSHSAKPYYMARRVRSTYCRIGRRKTQHLEKLGRSCPWGHPEAVHRIIPMFLFLASCRRARFPEILPAPGLTSER